LLPRILIDGRSGSGKTEFARELAAGLPGAQLVRLDDLYPGWGGLEAGSMAVHTDVLSRFRWRRFDWEGDRLAEWHSLDPARPIVVEGCGALSAANRSLATLGLWVELNDVTRKRRALLRDGDSYAPHWDDWAAQEDAFIAREHPRERADAVVDGVDVTSELARWLSLSTSTSGAA
jgi:uridine kinase